MTAIFYFIAFHNPNAAAFRLRDHHTITVRCVGFSPDVGLVIKCDASQNIAMLVKTIFVNVSIFITDPSFSVGDIGPQFMSLTS